MDVSVTPYVMCYCDFLTVSIPYLNSSRTQIRLAVMIAKRRRRKRKTRKRRKRRRTKRR